MENNQDSPTKAPTDGPTPAPTDSPTPAPTNAPTRAPTVCDICAVLYVLLKYHIPVFSIQYSKFSF